MQAAQAFRCRSFAEIPDDFYQSSEAIGYVYNWMWSDIIMLEAMRDRLARLNSSTTEFASYG